MLKPKSRLSSASKAGARLTPQKASHTAKNAPENWLEPQIGKLAGQLVDGVYHTTQYPAESLPPILTNAFELRLKKHPIEVIDFNKRMFQKFLVNEMFLPQEKADGIIRSLSETNAFSKTGFNPYKCEVRKAVGSDGELESLRFALGLANDEPDTLVWSTFGLGTSKDRSLDPTYFVNCVVKNPDRDYSFWPRLIVLLSAADIRISPVVQKCLEQEQNFYRLDNYLGFFLKLQQYPQARKVLDKYEQLTFDELRTVKSEEEKKQVRETIARQVKEFFALFDRYGCRDSELLDRLRQLEKPIGG